MSGHLLLCQESDWRGLPQGWPLSKNSRAGTEGGICSAASICYIFCNVQLLLVLFKPILIT